MPRYIYMYINNKIYNTYSPVTNYSPMTYMPDALLCTCIGKEEMTYMLDTFQHVSHDLLKQSYFKTVERGGDLVQKKKLRALLLINLSRYTLLVKWRQRIKKIFQL